MTDLQAAGMQLQQEVVSLASRQHQQSLGLGRGEAQLQVDVGQSRGHRHLQVILAKEGGCEGKGLWSRHKLKLQEVRGPTPGTVMAFSHLATWPHQLDASLALYPTQTPPRNPQQLRPPPPRLLGNHLNSGPSHSQSPLSTPSAGFLVSQYWPGLLEGQPAMPAVPPARPTAVFQGVWGWQLLCHVARWRLTAGQTSCLVPLLLPAAKLLRVPSERPDPVPLSQQQPRSQR